MLESVLARFRKDVQSSYKKPVPQSYEELAAGVESLEDLLKQRGINIDKDLEDFPEYLERMAQANPPKILYGNDVPMTGSIHISLGREVRAVRQNKHFASRLYDGGTRKVLHPLH